MRQPVERQLLLAVFFSVRSTVTELPGVTLTVAAPLRLTDWMLVLSVNVVLAASPELRPVAVAWSVEFGMLPTCQVAWKLPSATPSKSPAPPSVTSQAGYWLW